MYTPSNQERAVGLRKWAEALMSNPDNARMPKRYLEGIRRRALAEVETLESQPQEVAEELDLEDVVVPESFIELLAQPIEED